MGDITVEEYLQGMGHILPKAQYFCDWEECDGTHPSPENYCSAQHGPTDGD